MHLQNVLISWWVTSLPDMRDSKFNQSRGPGQHKNKSAPFWEETCIVVNIQGYGAA